MPPGVEQRERLSVNTWVALTSGSIHVYFSDLSLNIIPRKYQQKSAINSWFYDVTYMWSFCLYILSSVIISTELSLFRRGRL